MGFVPKLFDILSLQLWLFEKSFPTNQIVYDEYDNTI